MENIKKLIEEPLKKLNLNVYEVNYIKGNPNQLNIILDSNDIINIETIVKATKILSPIIDDSNIINEQYILDVSSKEKGVIENE